MKKELAIALPLALGVPMVASASCTVDNTGGDDSKASACHTSNGSGDAGTLSNLSSDVDIQASAGVALKAEDGSLSSPSVGANEIGVTACHEGGSAAFFGDTGGGSVQKNGDFGTGNCSTSNIGWSNAAST